MRVHYIGTEPLEQLAHSGSLAAIVARVDHNRQRPHTVRFQCGNEWVLVGSGRDYRCDVDSVAASGMSRGECTYHRLESSERSWREHMQNRQRRDRPIIVAATGPDCDLTPNARALRFRAIYFDHLRNNAKILLPSVVSSICDRTDGGYRRVLRAVKP